MTFAPTSEQTAIQQAVTSSRRSIMISAYAGCGKTSTLELIAKDITEPSLALAFNVKIVKELEKRLPRNFTIKSFNGLGHAAWGRALQMRLTLDDKKIGRLTTTLLREEGYTTNAEEWGSIRSLVSSAMKVGLTHSDYTHATSLVADTLGNWRDLASSEWIEVDDTQIGFAREILRRSIKEGLSGIVSFDDQIYLSALFGGKFHRYNVTLVDESQDLSPLNHIQVAKSSFDRLIVVGDPKQAVYAFRGADSSSMTNLRALRKEWIDLPLAITFRCPKVLVKRASSHAPGFTAFHTNAEGELRSLLGRGWSWGSVPHDGSVAVLCRNNAPLLSFAFRLIRLGVRVQMLGRDIGKGLLALATKLAKEDSTTIVEFLAKLAEWKMTEFTKAIANDDAAKADRIADQAGCLAAVAEADGVTNAGQLRKRLIALFAADNARVTLSSGHRSKGLEWDNVLHLDPWRLPAKFARGKQIEQEKNLRYVIETRAKRTLIEANLDEFEDTEAATDVAAAGGVVPRDLRRGAHEEVV